MSQRITIEIKDKIATCLTELPVVCGNSDYVIDFVFDEEWNNHEVKTAMFVVNGKTTPQVFSGNVCPVPVIQNTLIAWVGVFAGTVDDGTLSTSTPALVKCIPCITDGDSIPAPPPDDVYNQIIDLINAGMLKGEQGEKGEKGDKGDKGDKGEDADTSKLVTLDTQQFITGQKTFSSSTYFDNYAHFQDITIDAINGVSFGGEDFSVTLKTPNDPTDDRDIYIPDASGTLATQEWVGEWLNQGECNEVYAQHIATPQLSLVGNDFSVCFIGNPNADNDYEVYMPDRNGTLLTEEKAEETYAQILSSPGPSYGIYGNEYGSTKQVLYHGFPGATNTNWLAMYGSGGTLACGNPTADNHTTNKKYVDDSFEWKLLGEIELTQEMVDEAGEGGVTALIIDLGAPIEKWYGETWVRLEMPQPNWTSNASSIVQFGATPQDAISKMDSAERCGLIYSQSISYGQILYQYQNTINIFTNWHDNLPQGTLYQLNAFGAYNYPYTAYATANVTTKTIMGKRYFAYTMNNNPKLPFPVGTKLKLYGRF